MYTSSKKIKTISTSPFFSELLSFLSPKTRERPTRPLLLRNLSTAAEFSNDFWQVFQYFDENGDGKVSPSELRNGMRNIGEELSAEDAEAVLALSDSDGDGFLKFEEFVELVEVEGDEEKGEELKEAFQVYEMEGRGCITPKSLRRALGMLGEKKSIEECKVMIRRFDLNGDGVISFDEFRVMMV
ncbi:uncharacterized protein A4U43_C05F15850 [Asparagus officinalis]|uniref:EF-hand domain-containing protein n=1 Tax=Asparagus officinalis TaxID=4686 RepID=A0A5P1ESY1_ASPOF|nr:putative calcium-binding protein CML19 [Asparagus officinalis]ONK68773.1 uncharacterized protein A4U43_C05F15850 [Asparagus officinalis]